MSSRAAACVEKLGLKGVSLGMGGKCAFKRAETARICVPGLEVAFPQGLPASLHLMEAASTKDAASVSAVALALLRHVSAHGTAAHGTAAKRKGVEVKAAGGKAAQGTVVWITQSLAAGEAGAPYGPGFVEHGHDPARFLFIEARRPVDALWAMEECLRSRAISAVVAELHDQNALDLTATRRLALRAERAEVPALIVSHMMLGEAALAARSRWQIAAAPSCGASAHDTLIGPPAFHIAITKNRDGLCPRLHLTLDLETATFRASKRTTRTLRPTAPAPPTGDGAAQDLIAPAVVRLAAERRQRAEAARMRS